MFNEIQCVAMEFCRKDIRPYAQKLIEKYPELGEYTDPTKEACHHILDAIMGSYQDTKEKRAKSKSKRRIIEVTEDDRRNFENIMLVISEEFEKTPLNIANIRLMQQKTFEARRQIISDKEQLYKMNELLIKYKMFSLETCIQFEFELMLGIKMCNNLQLFFFPTEESTN